MIKEEHTRSPSFWKCEKCGFTSTYDASIPSAERAAYNSVLTHKCSAPNQAVAHRYRFAFVRAFLEPFHLFRNRIYYYRKYPKSMISFNGLYKDEHIEVGEDCHGEEINLAINKSSTLKIGSNTQMGRGTWLICSEMHDKDNPASVIEDVGFIEIGDNVRIGVNAIILKNVKIGNSATIGAGAVVTKDVAPYDVVVGNPARSIKKKVSEKKVE